MPFFGGFGMSYVVWALYASFGKVFKGCGILVGSFGKGE